MRGVGSATIYFLLPSLQPPTRHTCHCTNKFISIRPQCHACLRSLTKICYKWGKPNEKRLANKKIVSNSIRLVASGSFSSRRAMRSWKSSSEHTSHSSYCCHMKISPISDGGDAGWRPNVTFMYGKALKCKLIERPHTANEQRQTRDLLMGVAWLKNWLKFHLMTEVGSAAQVFTI